MSEIRQLLRYEIQGFLAFIYILLIILPFIASSGFSRDVIKILSESLIAFAIVAIPIGWLIYQIYDTHHPKYYVDRDSIEVLREWLGREFVFPRGKRARMETIYEELVNFFYIGDSNDNREADENFFGDKSLLDNLHNYWDHYDARYIGGKYVGFYIPILSGISVFLVYILYFKELWYCFLFSIGIIIVIVLISYFWVYKPRLRVFDEISTLECFLLLFNREKIRRFEETYQANPDLRFVVDTLTRLGGNQR